MHTVGHETTIKHVSDDVTQWPCTTSRLEFISLIGSRALALADPYCQSAWNSVCLFVCLFVRNFEVKYLGNQRC